jgi:bacteriocin-like protein
MKEKLKQLGSLKLGKEISKNEMKNVVGGFTCMTICTGGTYFGFCSQSYCAGAGHGTFVMCSGC